MIAGTRPNVFTRQGETNVTKETKCDFVHSDKETGVEKQKRKGVRQNPKQRVKQSTQEVRLSSGPNVSQIQNSNAKSKRMHEDRQQQRRDENPKQMVKFFGVNFHDLVVVVEALWRGQHAISQCFAGPQMSVQDWPQETRFEVKAPGVLLQRSAEVQKHWDVVGHRGQELQNQKYNAEAESS